MSNDGVDLLGVGEIEQMLDAGAAEIKNGQVVKIGDLEGTMIVNAVDAVTLWDRRTGIPTEVIPYNGNQTLYKMLAKRDATGQRVFTSTKPDFEPKRGAFVCYFHPSHPRYDEFMEQGYPPCRKSGIPNESEVRKHVRNRHKAALEQIEQSEFEAKERESRDAQQRTADAMLQAIQALAGSRSEAPVEEPEAPRTGFPCDACTFSSATEQGLKTHIGRVHGGD